MKRLTINAVVIVGVLLALAVVCMPALMTAAEPENFVVGYIGPLTGPAAPWGLDVSRGGQYFLDQANAKGGVKVGGKTYTFKIINYDHGLDPAKAIELAKRLIFSDKANLIVTQSTLCVIPVLPLTTQNKLVTIHMTYGRKSVTPEFPYAFRCCLDGIFPEAAAYGYAKDTLGLKTVVSILADDESGWENFQDAMDASAITGLKLLGVEYFVRGTKDFYPVLTRVLAKKPDVISYGAGSPGDCYLIIKQAYELGFKGLITGSAPLDVAQLKKMATNEALANVLLVLGGAPDIPEYDTPEELDMKKAMIEKYGKGGKLSDMFVEHMWQACNWAPIYLQAIQKADSLDPDKVAKALETGTFRVLGRDFRFGGKKRYGIAHQILVNSLLMRIINGVPKVVAEYKIGAGE